VLVGESPSMRTVRSALERPTRSKMSSAPRSAVAPSSIAREEEAVTAADGGRAASAEYIFACVGASGVFGEGTMPSTHGERCDSALPVRCAERRTEMPASGGGEAAFARALRGDARCTRGGDPDALIGVECAV
jgi:hypothetical protein